MSAETATMPEVNIDVAQEREKPRLEALLFADYGIVANDGKAVIVGVINQIHVDPKTKETGRFYLFIRAVGIPEYKFEIVIFDPSGKSIIAGEVKGEESKDTSGQKAIQLLQPFALAPVVEGTYWFSVVYKGQAIGGAALLIQYRKQEVKNGSDSNLESRRKPRKTNRRKTRANQV